MPASSRPAPLRTDGSNAFAHRSMAERVPGVIDDVRARNADYHPSIQDALQRLRDDVVGNAPLRLFALPAPDYDLWASRFASHARSRWLDGEWFFNEMLVYRLMVEATRFWTTGRDLFRPFKEEEMASDALWELLGQALADEGPLEARLGRALTQALWGNRMDLSMQNVMAQGTTATEDHLLTNHVPAVVRHLLDASPGAVHLFMDNAGTEQAFDFLLTDTLLNGGLATTVTLHIKRSPVLVSDVIAADVYRLLGLMVERGGVARALAGRLRRAMADGRLRLAPDRWWNTDARLWALPPRLHTPLSEATLVIGKGDVNYRRATNDALWPAGTTLERAVAPFPAPLLLLRTVKSDTLVGVEAATVERLDRTEPGWREVGTYGVAQFAPQGRPPSPV